MQQANFDFIIVGAGSAGCVLANRLSADPGNRVLLVEAGGADGHPWIRMPLKFRDLTTNRRFNWNYTTEGETYLDNRPVNLPRGRVLGGSSSINGMMYCRCHPLDYDQWAQKGLPGWSYSDVLPYFKRSEDFYGGEDAYHGAGGPLSVTRSGAATDMQELHMRAGASAGYPTTTDHNGERQEGFGPADLTIKGGQRASVSRTFLKPALGRPNLTLVTQAMVKRIVIDKARAMGIEYLAGGQLHNVRAEREVIVSGGAYNSPQILKLSGIGPADELAAHGIAVVHDSPKVGTNLQDHLHVGVGYRAIGLQGLDRELRLDRLVMSVLKWGLFKKGVLASIPVDCLGYVRTRPELERPDIELLMNRFHPLARIWFPGLRASAGSYIGCRPTMLHPQSRGTVKLRSGNFQDKPIIHHNYLSDPADMATMRAGIRVAREFYASETMRGLVGDEIFPGKGIVSEADLDRYIRANAVTMYHPTSTCAMGSYPDSVVDGQLRVNGVAGLRVVDASVMPDVPGGHTNAPTIMIAEKASDMILGRATLRPAAGLAA